jgi:hypothetical protein
MFCVPLVFSYGRVPKHFFSAGLNGSIVSMSLPNFPWHEPRQKEVLNMVRKKVCIHLNTMRLQIQMS